MTVIDLTLPIELTEPYGIPDLGYSDPPTQITTWVDIGQTIGGNTSPFCVSQIRMSLHTGTHIDAPRHFHKDGATLNELSPDELSGWTVVVDVSRSQEVTGDDLAEHRERAGTAGVLPLIITHPDGAMLTQQAVDELNKWHNRVLVFSGSTIDGEDFNSPHLSGLLKAGKFIVSNLNDEISKVRDGDQLVVAPLLMARVEGSPCRVVAVRGAAPWFDIEKVKGVDNVYSILEPGHDEYVRSHLVIGSKKAALIDTGWGIDNIRNVVERLTDLPITVILTHSHWDHMGGAHLFDDGKTEIYVHGDELEQIRKGYPKTHKKLEEAMRDKHFGRPGPPWFKGTEFRIPGVKSVLGLSGGEVFDLGGRKLKIVHTPGHTPGSISILDEINSLLFTGDTFYWGPLYIADDMYEGANRDPLNDYLDTSRTLAKLDVKRVFPGHNELERNKKPMGKADLSNLKKALEANDDMNEICERGWFTFEWTK